MLVVADLHADALPRLLSRYGLTLETVAPGRPITGSFWGDSEAGIVGTKVYARADTPLHSVLHEACHIICMSPDRREDLDGDAGGDDLEEAAVCYLQILLAEELSGAGSVRLLADMDAWGYSFRLGDAASWFRRDAEDARTWLLETGLIDARGRPSFRCRM